MEPTPLAGVVLVHVEGPCTGPVASVHDAPPTFTTMPSVAPAGAPLAGANLTVTVSVVTSAGTVNLVDVAPPAGVPLAASVVKSCESLFTGTGAPDATAPEAAVGVVERVLAPFVVEGLTQPAASIAKTRSG